MFRAFGNKRNLSNIVPVALTEPFLLARTRPRGYTNWIDRPRRSDRRDAPIV